MGRPPVPSVSYTHGRVPQKRNHADPHSCVAHPDSEGKSPQTEIRGILPKSGARLGIPAQALEAAPPEMKKRLLWATVLISAVETGEIKTLAHNRRFFISGSA